MIRSDHMNILMAIVSIFLWLYVYLRLKSSKVYTFAFIVGSIGFFSIGILFFRDILEEIIVLAELKIISLFKIIFHNLDIYIQNSTVIIKTDSVAKAITLNYECSGLIESLVYSSIVFFYPIKNNYERFQKLILGNLIILGANILRIILMVVSVSFLGVKTFDIVHLFIGRMIFYAIIVALYYKILTQYHISQYKEG